MSDEEKKDSNQKENQSNPLLIGTESGDKKGDSQNHKNPTKEMENPMSRLWTKFRENSNAFIAIASITTFFLFFYLSTNQINESHNSSMIELRAYLQVDSVFFYIFKSGKEIGITVRVANVGQTPAYNVRGIQYPKIGGTGIYEADFLTLSQRDTMTSMFIGGNRSYIDFRMATDFIPSKGDSIDISTGRLFLGYFGKFFYEDIFGRTDSFKVCQTYYAKTGNFVLCDNYQGYYPPAQY